MSVNHFHNMMLGMAKNGDFAQPQVSYQPRGANAFAHGMLNTFQNQARGRLEGGTGAPADIWQGEALGYPSQMMQQNRQSAGVQPYDNFSGGWLTLRRILDGYGV